MKEYDYILFDLDGTITDSKPGIITCIKYALDKKNIPYTNDILDKMIGPPFRVSMHDFLGLELPMIEELIYYYRSLYEIDGWKDCSVYNGVEEMFTQLQKAGKHLAVATSKPLKFTNIMIDGLNLRHYFEYVAGSTSDASKESKADVIQLCLDYFDIKDKSKVLMVGDRLYDIEGAHICGIDCVAELWGYGNKEEFIEYNADYIRKTPQEIVDLILNKD